jgi:hypothetical protein
LKNALAGFDHEQKWSRSHFHHMKVKFANTLFDSWSSLAYRCIVVPTEQINKAARMEKRSLLRAKLKPPAPRA